MKKRLIFVILCVLCYPLVYTAIFFMFPIGIYALVKYIITGEGTIESVFRPFNWVTNLPNKIIAKL